MVHVVGELKRAGLSIPVMIGGATTSRLHTALKIAPVYDGPVIWMKDASQRADGCPFLNPDTEGEAFRELREEQERLRESAGTRRVETVSIEEARQKKLNLF